MSILFGSLGFDSVRFVVVRFGSIQFDSFRYGRVGSTRFDSTWSDYARFGSIRVSAVRFSVVQVLFGDGSFRFGSATLAAVSSTWGANVLSPPCLRIYMYIYIYNMPYYPEQ